MAPSIEHAENSDAAVPNAQRRPKRGFEREPHAEAEMPRTAVNPDPSDIATGRGPTYEWEFLATNLLQRVKNIEISGGGGSAASRYEHTQAVPAATWTINHGLGLIPSVTVVGTDDQEVKVEIHFPDANTVVIKHAYPFAGTAYLIG